MGALILLALSEQERRYGLGEEVNHKTKNSHWVKSLELTSSITHRDATNIYRGLTIYIRHYVRH